MYWKAYRTMQPGMLGHAIMQVLLRKKPVTGAAIVQACQSRIKSVSRTHNYTLPVWLKSHLRRFGFEGKFYALQIDGTGPTATYQLVPAQAANNNTA
jgi:hypothetical protein